MQYATLRGRGLEHVQALAADTWTDHNVHDPGITILEAFCYAMTESGFRVQLDVADLLKSGEGHSLPNLVPLHRLLPSSPVHQKDLRDVLLDHYLVGDASVTAHADSELALFENTTGPDQPLDDPPLVEAPVNGSRELEFRGLLEVLLEFRDLDLNSNTYTADVTSADGTFTLDFALPHWDEEGAAPLLEEPTINLVTMLDPGTGFWRKLEESQTFFGQIQVDFTGSGGPGSTELWVVMRITNEGQAASVVSGILAASKVDVEALGGGTLIDRYVGNISGAFTSVRRVEHYLYGWRNLCQDLIRLSAARVQEIAIRARIEVTGSTNLEALLAKIFFAIDCAISPPVTFSGLDDLKAAGKTAEQIFEGPLLRHGFLKDIDQDGFVNQSQIYVSDVLRLIMRLRNESGTDLVAQESPSGRDIVAITDLSLSNFVNNRPITRNAYDCLRLVDPGRYRPRLSIAKSHIEFVRDDVQVPYDFARVSLLFEDLRAEKAAVVAPDEQAPAWPAPAGEALPIEEYYPFQNDLPRVYGLGEAGLPDSAGPKRHAHARQAKGYLMLFEQFLADVASQLANVNRFFSSDPDVSTSYFTHPLYEVPDVRSLIKQFPAGADWDSFVQDQDNPYRRALKEAAEDEDRFLDRRNRMFDHLLARFGEEAIALGQELHRWSRKQLTDVVTAPALLQQKLTERRRDVNRRLIVAKSGFLHDVPELSMSRLQAYGDPVHRRPEILSVSQSGPNQSWLLTLDSDELLESVDTHTTSAAATVAASEAAILASQVAFYSVVPDGGGLRRYQLNNGVGGTPIARSPQTFGAIAAAQAAADASADRFRRLRIRQSITPMEKRAAHLSAIRRCVRQELLVPIPRFFEVFDDPDPDPLIDKRWRLWSEEQQSGEILLVSSTQFEAAVDPDAVALTLEGIDEALRHAIDEWNYDVQPAGPGFAIDLHDPNDTSLASRPSTLPSVAAGEDAVDAAVAHVYENYSVEGMHMVEHLLLRPRESGDPVLSIPISKEDKERDPYSHRFSIVLPSGLSRDFTDDPLEATRNEVRPHRFRDREFRRHAERMIRQACPAHLLPKIYWVDQQAPGTANDPASFNRFEVRYFAWLESILIPGTPALDVRNARSNLVESLNAIVNA